MGHQPTWLILRGQSQQGETLIAFASDEQCDTVVLDDLALWASGDVRQDGSHRGVLDELLTIDGLAVAALTGIVGNAAWSVFPAASRFIRNRRRAGATAASSTAIAAVKQALAQIAPEGAKITISELSRRADGAWQAVGGVDNARYRLLISESATVVAMKRLSEPSIRQEGAEGR